MVPNQTQIASAIGWIVRVQGRRRQSAVAVAAPLFLQPAGRRQIPAQNRQPSLAHFHFTSKVRQQPRVPADDGEEVEFEGSEQDARQSIRRQRIAEIFEILDGPLHGVPPICRQHQRMRSWTLERLPKSTSRSKLTATYSSFISVCSENPDCSSSGRNFATAGWMKYLACLATSSVPRSSGVPSDMRLMTSSMAMPYWQSSFPSGLISSSHPSAPRSRASGPSGSN